jgi:hypothetical protein
VWSWSCEKGSVAGTAAGRMIWRGPKEGEIWAKSGHNSLNSQYNNLVLWY